MEEEREGGRLMEMKGNWDKEREWRRLRGKLEDEV